MPQRLAEMLQRLTNQLNGVLFPVVVDSDAGERPERLRAIFVQGTRLSLVSVVPLAAAMVLLAGPADSRVGRPEVRSRASSSPRF